VPIRLEPVARLGGALPRRRRFVGIGDTDRLPLVFDWLPPDVELVRDVQAADWIVATLESWSHSGIRVESFVPAGFEAYVRVLHPFEDWDGRRSTFHRWGDVGAEHGIAIGPDTSVEDVLGTSSLDPAGVVGTPGSPGEGEVPTAVCRELVALLSPRTTTPEACWFAVWSGWGLLGTTSAEFNMLVPRLVRRPWRARLATRRHRRHQRIANRKATEVLNAIPQIAEPYGPTGRRYLLFRGPVDAACSLEPMKPHRVSPSFWWPEDRAWIVVSEIDGTSTYVAGTRETIDEVLGSTLLEAVEVTRAARMG